MLVLNLLEDILSIITPPIIDTDVVPIAIAQLRNQCIFPLVLKFTWKGGETGRPLLTPEQVFGVVIFGDLILRNPFDALLDEFPLMELVDQMALNLL